MLNGRKTAEHRTCQFYQQWTVSSRCSSYRERSSANLDCVHSTLAHHEFSGTPVGLLECHAHSSSCRRRSRPRSHQVRRLVYLQNKSRRDIVDALALQAVFIIYNTETHTLWDVSSCWAAQSGSLCSVNMACLLICYERKKCTLRTAQFKSDRRGLIWASLTNHVISRRVLLYLSRY